MSALSISSIKYHAAVRGVRFLFEFRHGRPADPSLLVSTRPVERPPERAGLEKPPDGEAFKEPTGHSS